MKMLWNYFQLEEICSSSFVVVHREAAEFTHPRRLRSVSGSVRLVARFCARQPGALYARDMNASLGDRLLPQDSR